MVSPRTTINYLCNFICTLKPFSQDPSWDVRNWLKTTTLAHTSGMRLNCAFRLCSLLHWANTSRMTLNYAVRLSFLLQVGQHVRDDVKLCSPTRDNNKKCQNGQEDVKLGALLRDYFFLWAIATGKSLNYAYHLMATATHTAGPERS